MLKVYAILSSSFPLKVIQNRIWTQYCQKGFDFYNYGETTGGFFGQALYVGY